MTDHPRDFNNLAKTVFAPVNPVIARQIVDRCKIKRGTCIDLGSGPALLTITLAEITDLSIYALDISEDVYEIAKENIESAGVSGRITPIVGDVHDMPFDDNAADLIMRFIPFGEADIDFEPTIRKSEILYDGVKNYLDIVYLFNSPGTAYLNTICPECGKTVFTRDFYGPMGARTTENKPDGVCECCYKIPFVGTISDEPFEEEGFFGGYRYTRALEMIHAILAALKVDDGAIGEIWCDILRSDYFREFHKKIQKIDSYLGIMRYFAEYTGKEGEGEELIDYIKKRVNLIASKSKEADRPGVYYAIGYPLFTLNGERFENDLVEASGGESVNRLIEREGKPGINISRDEFIKLNPEIIFISGFLSCPVSDFYEYCMKHELDVDAVKNKKIYRIPPGWDFGSPRWILGLMYIANRIHPEIFNFDMEKEADEFYRTFYGVEFSSMKPNRAWSFYKQSAERGG